MHCEQVVKPRTGKAVWAIKAFIIICSFLFCNFIFSNIIFIAGMYGAIVYPVVFGIVWILFRSMSFEFEYSFSGGILLIEKITAKSKRSVLAVCDVKKALSYGKITELSTAERNSPSLPCVYAQDTVTESIMYIEYPSDTGTRMRLYFSPDAHIRAVIEQNLPFTLH